MKEIKFVHLERKLIQVCNLYSIEQTIRIDFRLLEKDNRDSSEDGRCRAEQR